MNVPDIIESNLDVLFVGINPGMESARVGKHFAHATNRFWSTLHQSGFTPTLLNPSENNKLLDYNVGITNVVDRATRNEAGLEKHEFTEGRSVLEEKIIKYKPKWVAFVGIGLYRKTYQHPKATIGKQEDIGDSKVWVLPQPSGLNAHYPPERLLEVYKEFYNFVYP